MEVFTLKKGYSEIMKNYERLVVISNCRYWRVMVGGSFIWSVSGGFFADPAAIKLKVGNHQLSYCKIVKIAGLFAVTDWTARSPLTNVRFRD